MKKLVPLLLIAAGATAYFVNKKMKESKDKVSFVSVDEEGMDDFSSNPEEIHDLDEDQAKYPYLSNSFIQDSLDYEAELESLYAVGDTLELSHVFKIENVDSLIALIQKLKTNHYSIGENEEGAIVATRSLVLEHGKISSEIFEVANDVFLFHGEYLGFQID